MLMTDIILRRTADRDREYLAQIMDDEWGFHLYSERNGLNMSEHYLLHCMNGATDSITAVVDGIPSGIIVIDTGSGTGMDLSKDMDALYGRFLDDPGLDLFERDCRGIDEAFDSFRKELCRPGWGELRLLIVSKNCKGMGLGRMLLKKAARILDDSGMEGLFFYTDTECNIGFYDHLGAFSVGHKDVPCMNDMITVYGYGLDIDDIK